MYITVYFRFLEMYDLDWDKTKMTAKESWDFAASWVQSRQIHPDYAPEIGELNWVLIAI